MNGKSGLGLLLIEQLHHSGRLIHNWTKDLTIFTNGKSELTQEQTDELKRHNIAIVEKDIASLKHKDGVVEEIIFSDNSTFKLEVIYSRPPFEQHCKMPELLGCELTEQGLIKVVAFQKTTVDNIFACGDSTNPLRSVPYVFPDNIQDLYVVKPNNIPAVSFLETVRSILGWPAHLCLREYISKRLALGIHLLVVSYGSSF